MKRKRAKPTDEEVANWDFVARMRPTDDVGVIDWGE